MTYPTGTEYSGAVQDPDALLDPELARAVFALHPTMFIPWPTSGNSAVVFKATIDGRVHALRFFIREDASSRERYNTLGSYLRQQQLTDSTAAAQWVDDAIRIRGQRWPMVKMEWIDGRALDAYVESLALSENRAALLALASTWLQLVRRMQDVRFAHGDLQHGNVLVDTGSRLRLVDFDGCWMPASAGGPSPTETGHPNYQLRNRPWGQWMDTFPGLLVYTALRGLAREPTLWKAYGARENILFTKDDFSQPFETPVWSDLQALGDAEITHGLTQLSAACGAAGGLTVPLSAVVDDSRSGDQGRADQGSGTSRPVFTTGPLRSTRWWEKTGWTDGQAPAGSSPLPPPPPPRSQPSSDPRFDAAHEAAWHGPSARSTGSSGGAGGSSATGGAAAGTRATGAGGSPGGGGPGRGGSASSAGGAAPPPGGGGTTRPYPPSRPAPPPKKRSGWRPIAIIIVVVLAVILLVIIVGAAFTSSGSTSSGSYSDSGDSSGSTSWSPSPEVTSPSVSDEPSTEAELLQARVPAPLSSSCSEFEPADKNPAVAALTCSDSASSISVSYYSYADTDDLASGYEQYSTSAEGVCAQGESGHGSYPDSAGNRLGDYSCYSTKKYHVLTWTDEPARILVVAYSESVHYPELISWAAANAGPV